MTLVRIGQTTINFDLVTRIRDLSTKDSTGTVVPGPMEIYFGPGAPLVIATGTTSLRNWVISKATDTTSTSSP